MAAGWARFAHRFGAYYRSSEFWTPPRLKTREWMFIPFGGAPPISHKGFTDMKSVQNFIRTGYAFLLLFNGLLGATV